LLKALSAIIVNPDGNTTDVKAVPRNANSLITRNDDGNNTEVKPEPKKAPEPISVTPSGIVAEPTHAVLPVTTFDATVNVPLVPHATVPSATACAIGLETNAVAIRTADAMTFKPRLPELIGESYHR
jgi:hypothetical protein